MATKTKSVIVRMDDVEYGIIKKKAELSQMSISEYIRTACTIRQVHGYQPEEMDDLQGDQIEGQMSIEDFT